MSTTQDLPAPVESLLNRATALPAPTERARLRLAGNLTQAEVADALGVHRVQVARWETGRAEPRQPHRQTYARLLAGLASKLEGTHQD
ncbi:helix-turn-helix transcriptional regulator [Streptomyces sp. NPDC060011]|uniref:helix-turn-helix transcriptional regulator n=1 Tax=Streptomyces sp. NPDC060011 TaxID=3347037 RepID=UPI00369962BA